MLFKDIFYLDENFEVKKGDILVENGVIKQIGKDVESEKEKIYDGKEKFLMPGLVNSHTHIPMSLLRGYGEGLPLQRWLEERVFPFEDKMTDESAYWGSMLGIAELLACGVTSFSEMYMFGDGVTKAIIDTGIKANYARAIVSFDETPLKENERFIDSLKFYEKFKNDPKIKIDFALHAEYTNTEKTVCEIAEYSKKVGGRFHIHLSETYKEHEECKQRHTGKTPTQFFNECGIFESKTLAAHAVFVESSDIKILSKKGVSVSHNPSSNLKLGSGIAPIKEMLTEGINVCIGTDGVASNNNLNMFEELHLASLIHKGVNRDPLCISDSQLIKMATVNGAYQQDRKDCGVIKEGYKADLIVVSLSAAHMKPFHDLRSNILYSAGGSDVVMTMVDGEVLYENGIYRTLDIDIVCKEVMKETDRILKALDE